VARIREINTPFYERGTKMINRRNFFGSLGAVVAGLATPLIANEPVEKEPLRVETNRQARYRRYRQIYKWIPRYPFCKDVTNLIDDTVNEWMWYKDLKDYVLFRNIETDPSVKARICCWASMLAITGDVFLELVKEDNDLLFVTTLVPDSMYSITTIKGKILEYQESMHGPDYAAFSQFPLENAHKDLASKVVRFHPDQILHMKIDNPIFHPYGLSLLYEPVEFATYKLDNPNIKRAYKQAFFEGMEQLIKKV
jgi:hypothetical protein